METINNKIIRSEASKTALWFGLISGGYILISIPLACSGKTALSIFANLLDLAKIVGCIWLMRYVMFNLKKDFDGVGKRELLKYGTYIALFSAIITTAVTYISYQYLFPNTVASIFNSMYVEMQQTGIDANTSEMLTLLESKYIPYVTIGTFIWCFIFGRILSRILAPRIAPKSIFED